MSCLRIIMQDFGFSVYYSASCHLFCFLNKNFKNVISIHHPSSKRLLNIIHKILWYICNIYQTFQYPAHRDAQLTLN